MAGQSSVNVSDPVLLTGTVITQEHNLKKCQSVWHKIDKFFLLDGNGFGLLKIPFVIISCTCQKQSLLLIS